jgi:hypothetical protein
MADSNVSTLKEANKQGHLTFLQMTVLRVVVFSTSASLFYCLTTFITAVSR